MSGTVIKLKYSEVNSQPADDSLAHAEPAYSYLSGRLWIGKNNGSDVIEAKQIGGEYFTALLDHTGGTNQALVDNTVSALLTDTEGYVDELLTEALTIGTSGGAGVRITSILTDISGAVSNVQLPTASAVKSYVDAQLGSTSLTDLDDVTLGTLSNAQILVYNNSTGQWANKSITGDATISNGGTLTLSNSGVTAGSYGGATAIPVFTLDAKGRVTNASTATVATTLNVRGDDVVDASATPVDLLTDTLKILGGVGLSTTTSSDTITVALDNTAVTADTYGSTTEIPVITIDAQGRITAASTASVATTLSVDSGSGSGDTGSSTVDLLSDTLVFSGDDDVAVTITEDNIAVSLRNTTVSPGTYGSASLVPTFTVDANGRITSASTSFVSTNVSIAGDTGSGSVTTGTALNIVGGTGIETAFVDSNDTLTITLSDIAGLTAQQYGSATQIPQLTVDLQGRITAISSLAINANSFGTISVTDTDSGFSWADTGSTVATSNAATLTYVSGNGIDIDVDSGSDAIRIENTGVVTLGGTNHISVSNTGTAYTVTSDGTAVNTVSTLVARDASGDFAASKATLTELQVDDININGHIISSTTTDQNIQLSPDGVGIVEITSDTNVTGSLTITGDLTVSGTSTQINVSELVVEDPIIYLASSVAGTESSTDVGFVANIVDGGVYGHSGLVRHKADGIWYLFDGYTEEVDENGNVIDPTHASFQIASLNANVVGALTGTADVASKLEIARAIKLTGDVVGNFDGSITFDGSGDITITTTIQENSVALGTDTTGNYVATIASENGGLVVSNSGTETAAVTIELDVTDSLFVEGAQDAVGAMLVGTYSNISISYDDANNVINASVPTASTTVRGVASFSSSNFAVSAGGEVSIIVIDGGTF